MRLSTLLDSHLAFSSDAGALKECFGDGYLLSKNRLYARVREATLEAGFRYSKQIDDFYLALPLSQLDSVIVRREIPYLNNVGVLESIESKIPKLTLWDDISDNLKGNHVFHESCHAVAQSWSRGFNGTREKSPLVDKVLLLLLEESFANTCELLAIVDAHDQIHRVFFELNSFVYMLDDRMNLTSAIKEMGFAVVIRFMMLAYLHANFLRTLEDKELERTFSIASSGRPLDAKQKKTLRAISKIAFKLNPRFREVTTRFYLKMNGVSDGVTSLQDFDLTAAVEAHPQAVHVMAQAAKLLS